MPVIKGMADTDSLLNEVFLAGMLAPQYAPELLGLREGWPLGGDCTQPQRVHLLQYRMGDYMDLRRHLRCDCCFWGWCAAGQEGSDSACLPALACGRCSPCISLPNWLTHHQRAAPAPSGLRSGLASTSHQPCLPP